MPNGPERWQRVVDTYESVIDLDADDHQSGDDQCRRHPRDGRVYEPRAGERADGRRPGAAMLKTPASRLSPSDLALLHKGALDQCDALDGVTDRVIEHPRECKFDPRVLQCRAGATTNCLSADQVAAARAIYRGPTNARTDDPIMPGLEPGSELGWKILVDGNEPPKLGIVRDNVRKAVERSGFEYRRGDQTRGVRRFGRSGMRSAAPPR